MPGIDSKLFIPAEATHLIQAGVLHLGIVRDVKDPEGRGRVKVECPELNNEGQENWLNWCEVIGIPVSTAYHDGDYGDWWPLVPGQPVYVTFHEGDYLQPCCFPGPAAANEPSPAKALIPKEVKKITTQDIREGTRFRIKKSEAGHSLIMDDRGKKEKLALVDWTGAGLVLISPGKIEDDKEGKNEGSKPRKGELRGTKLVAAGTSKSVGEITRDNKHFLYTHDLNGQGTVTVAMDGEGYVAIFSANNLGEVGPSIFLDAKRKNIYLTAGDVQLQLLGEKGHIGVTRQIIKEVKRVDIESVIKSILNAIKKEFEDIK